MPVMPARSGRGRPRRGIATGSWGERHGATIERVRARSRVDRNEAAATSGSRQAQDRLRPPGGLADFRGNVAARETDIAQQAIVELAKNAALCGPFGALEDPDGEEANCGRHQGERAEKILDAVVEGFHDCGSVNYVVVPGGDTAMKAEAGNRPMSGV
jgi:hypothetical protein